MKKDHWDLPELGRSLVNEPECGLHLGLGGQESGKIDFEAPLRFCPLPVTCCVGDWNSRTKWEPLSIFLIVGGLEG